MSTPPNRRPSQPRPARQRREPLFPLESDDIGPRTRPPQPLGHILDDLSEAMPARAEPKPARPAASPQPRPAPAPERAAAPRRPEVATREPRATTPMLRAASAAERLADAAEKLRSARDDYDDSESDLRYVERMAARPYTGYSSPAAPPLVVSQWVVVAVVAAVSLLIIFTLGGGRGADGLSRWVPPFLNLGGDEPAQARLSENVNPVGDHRLQGAPSVTPDQIDQILASYGSPAAGTGSQWYNLGLQYGIDPAFAVAFFIHESSAGTNPAWAGIKSGGGTTHNVGNIICAGYPTCYGRFRDYPSWEAGIEDWYRLISVEYIKGRGTLTVQEIIPIYAPSFENDVQGYINVVTQLVDGWRANGVP